MANFLVHVGHPAHVHFFRNAIRKLLDDGHEVYVTAVDKEFTKKLLEEYGIPYETVGIHKKNLAGKFLSMLSYDRKFVKLMREKKVDAAAAIGSPSIAQAGYLTGTPSVIFTDTEAATVGNHFMAPFARIIATPECFQGDFGVKQLRYSGYHELAYLHPKYFKPEEEALTANGLKPGQPFVVVRFVSRVSLHDRGDVGLFRRAREVVERLESYGRVLVSSEAPLPAGLSGNLVKTPAKIHSLLHYASLYLGESPTMASEAAILGTPSIYAQQSRRGYTEEEEKKYGLVYNFHNPEDLAEKALSKAFELLSDADSKTKWAVKRERMLSEKVDVTEFTVNLLLKASVK
jgi:predicted glycosyltransferase